MSKLILGSRGSDLALTQTHSVRNLLLAALPGAKIEVKIIRTIGDERLDIDLTNPGPLDKGLFTKQLEDSLLRGEIDAAVHSLKDLPVDLPKGLALGAIPTRADPQDVLVSKHLGGLAGLPAGARVATSSARRQRFLAFLRPDVVVMPIRGNVPTRLRKVAGDAGVDALVLAKAGLDRLGDVVPVGLHVTVEPELLPAPGQGALGIECRADDRPTLTALASIHDVETARCVNAERALLRALGGGCAVPLGALATLHGDEVVLRSLYFGEPPGTVAV